jgi:hydroxymethylbilane synthase
VVKTSGDVFLDKPLHQLTGWGVFVAEIDEQMINGKIDLAVHSMKDIPTKRPEELEIAAILRRDSPWDILVTRNGSGIDDLPKCAVVGTSSMRRAAQLKRFRPDIQTKSLRGNLQTRLRKLTEGEYDAIVLAQAGIQRMGIDLEYSVLDPQKFVPSANQGTIVVVAKKGSIADNLVKSFDDSTTRAETMIERRILETVGGGCVVPVAIHANVKGDKADVVGEILSLDGTRFVRVNEEIPIDGFMDYSLNLGRRLLDMGGKELVEEAVKTVGKR